jgi:hypothetical protein
MKKMAGAIKIDAQPSGKPISSLQQLSSPIAKRRAVSTVSIVSMVCG